MYNLKHISEHGQGLECDSLIARFAKFGGELKCSLLNGYSVHYRLYNIIRNMNMYISGINYFIWFLTILF